MAEVSENAERNARLEEGLNVHNSVMRGTTFYIVVVTGVWQSRTFLRFMYVLVSILIVRVCVNINNRGAESAF